MRTAYSDVTRWVAFHAAVARRELQLCNDAWIAPHVALFLENPRPRADVPERLLALLEEAASAVWLMYGEEESLLERLRELFGPRDESLPHEISSVFDRASVPADALALLGRSLAARAALLEQHARDVDAHTRLVFRKHLTVLRNLVLPSIDSIAREARALGSVSSAEGPSESAGVVAEDDLLRLYDAFAPTAPRPHPDDFLSVALLRRDAPKAHAGSNA